MDVSLRGAVSIARRLQDLGQNAPQVALVIQPRLRRSLAALLRLRAPACLVLSISELPETQPIEVISVIGGGAPPQFGLPPPSSAPIESMAA